MQSRGRDLERAPWCYVLWGLPAVLAVGTSAAYQASALSPALAGLLWTSSVVWVGVGCFVNGRSCGRVHCKIDGVLFPLLGVAGLLNVTGVVSFSWSLFWIVFVVILAGSFVPELVWKRYS
ncbi:MAG: hypothetical protein OK449_09615 [Thaumarchaeota archaeon]|nr:hypothetical protein [Nitrososphaerota archaeon]